MKPDWDKLAGNFKGAKQVLIADVDCTAKGDSLCKKFDVKGYPTIKYWMEGEDEPKDYDGGRSYDDLEKFVEDTYKAGCNVRTEENCRDIQKKVMSEYKDFDLTQLQEEIQRLEEVKKQMAEEKQFITDGGKDKMKDYKKEKAGIMEIIKTARVFSDDLEERARRKAEL